MQAVLETCNVLCLRQWFLQIVLLQLHLTLELSLQPLLDQESEAGAHPCAVAIAECPDVQNRDGLGFKCPPGSQFLRCAVPLHPMRRESAMPI